MIASFPFIASGTRPIFEPPLANTIHAPTILQLGRNPEVYQAQSYCRVTARTKARDLRHLKSTTFLDRSSDNFRDDLVR
jgi:hypothetical protein